MDAKRYSQVSLIRIPGNVGNFKFQILLRFEISHEANDSGGQLIELDWTQLGELPSEIEDFRFGSHVCRLCI